MTVAPITVVMGGQSTVVAITDQSGVPLDVYMDGDLRTRITQPLRVSGKQQRTFYRDMGSDVTEAILVTALVEGEPAARSPLTLTTAGLTVTLPSAPTSIAGAHDASQAAAFAARTPWTASPAGWDAAWTAAKAAAGTTPATVAFIGDSTSAGQNSGDVMAANWIELIANDLATKYGRYADFYPMWTYCTRFNTNFVGTAPFSDPGAASGSSWEGGYGRAVELSATFSTVFTPPKNTNVIGFDLVYIDFSAGSFTAFPDAASPTTITTVVGGSYTSALLKKQSFTGLTPGAHTLTINGSAGHFCIVVGVTVYYAGGTGIGFTRSAFNGIRAVDLGTPGGATLGAGAAPSTPNDKILAWAGGTAGPASVNFDGIPGQPSLALVGLILNDAILGAGLVPYKTTLTRLVRSLRRGVTDCSIAFIVGSYPDSTYSDVVLAGNGAFYHRWKMAMREVALANSCAIIDVDGKWQSKGLALGFQGSGNLHPTAAGYADMYSTVKGVGVTT